jgi:Protein of unknown function (DUF3572)
MTLDRAMVIALNALGHIAGDEVLLQRFCRESGVDASDLRSLAGEPGFLGGVLDFMLADEARLLAFCEAERIQPGEPASARRALPGSDHEALA